MCSKKTTVYVCLLAGLAMALAMAGQSSGQNSSTATEAPSGYDNQPNGLTDAATFTMDRGKFEETEAIGDGLGPIFNAQSCRECHQNPVTGSTSQVKELRAGHRDNQGNFVAATATLADGTVTIANRSLINQRAICPAVDVITVNGQHRPTPSRRLRDRNASLSTLSATASSNPSPTRLSLIWRPPSVRAQVAPSAARPCMFPSWKPTALLPSAASDGRTSTLRFSRSPAMRT
jgi:hypothetical protein